MAAYGQHTGVFRPSSVLFGLVVFPGLTTVGQYLWTRRHPEPVVATGPVAHAIGFAAFAGLWVTWYPDPFVFLSDAALIFYGASMVLAAWRRYGGCEVLAISNWLLRRDDQVGCVVFWPVDRLDSTLGLTRDARRDA